MSDQFVAELRIFGFNFAPVGWALANGQLMPISQNTALFSLLGTTYGGDGKSTFALPDMQSNVPMQPGQGQGLSLRDLGETSGTETVTLLESEMPFHNHNFIVTSVNGANQTASGNQLGKGFKGNIQASNTCKMYSTAGSPQPNTAMSFQSLQPAGSSFPHNNMQPYLTLNFCIALQGIFPPRG
jgi:microcystin-dependent protein